MKFITHHILLCLSVIVASVNLFAQDALQTGDFPEIIDTQPKDDFPVSPEIALEKITLPKGFSAKLFAHEPDVQQPIDINFDARGRIWVAECYTYGGYPGWMENQRDRIVILEDTDGDGSADERKVFWDKANRLTSVLPGLGGVYILNDGTLSFIADENQDDTPDAKPVVLLDGFNKKEITHNIVNGLMWGPDGWIYGRHGIQATSYVGKPDSTPAERTKINCGIWRFHPQQQHFEQICQGTTNPWGLDYNDVGDFFFTNNVIGHLWHSTYGAHFKRMYGADFNPYTYELIDQIADHYHWNHKKKWTASRINDDEVDKLGGGHSHCGGMIYLSDTWPSKYRNSIFMCNTHGRRVNIDALVPSKSTYVGEHRNDFFLANQPYFRGVSIKQCPDGNILISDWVDNGECHDNDGVHRQSGRIYKVIYDDAPKLPSTVNFEAFDAMALAQLQLFENDWWCRMARLELQHRYYQKQDLTDAVKELQSIYKNHPDPTRKLRALWCLKVLDELSLKWLLKEGDHENPHVRKWILNLIGDELTYGELSRIDRNLVYRFLQKQAKQEIVPQVRLAFLSLLQRVPVAERLKILLPLCMYASDVEDNYYSLMAWYACEPCVTVDPEASLDLATRVLIPQVRTFIARKLTGELKQKPEYVDLLVQKIFDTKALQIQQELLQGLALGLKGWRKAQAPKKWEELSNLLIASNNKEIEQLVQEINVVFGDGLALEKLIKIAKDGNQSTLDRERALKVLAENRSEELLKVFIDLAKDRAVEKHVILGLAEYDNKQVPGLLIGKYKRGKVDIRRLIIETLTSRKGYVTPLLNAIKSNKIPQDAVTAFDARQIVNMQDKELTSLLQDVWGDVRSSSKENLKLIETWKKRLTDDRLSKADLSNGRLMFKKNCSNCHKLYGDGGNVGPDITGSNRDNLDYLLENIYDPSRIVGKQYRMSTIVRDDGKTFSGIILQKNDGKLVLQTQKEKLVIAEDEILEQKASEESLMPNGVIEKLKKDDVRDLFAYLRAKKQVELKAE